LNNLEICKILLNISKKLVKIGNQTKIIFIKDRPGHDLRYALNSNKIIKKLKWKPKVKFNEGLKNTFLWYLKNNTYYKSISKNHITKRMGNKK